MCQGVAVLAERYKNIFLPSMVDGFTITINGCENIVCFTDAVTGFFKLVSHLEGVVDFPVRARIEPCEVNTATTTLVPITFNHFGFERWVE